MRYVRYVSTWGGHKFLPHSYGGMSCGVSMQTTEFIPCDLPLLRRPFVGA